MSTPTGPRLNAMKHGLRATDELFLAHLTIDEESSFQSLRDSLHEELKPQSEQEKLLVDKIAIQHFRALRIYQFEYIASRDSHSAPLGRESYIHHLDRFSLYDYRVEQQLKSLFNQLKWLYYRRGDRSLVFVTLPTGVRSFALPASPESTEISNPTC